MFQMFKQMFSALTILFGAAEKGAKALDHLAVWSEETAGAFADEARMQRQIKIAQLQANNAKLIGAGSAAPATAAIAP